MNCLNSLLSEDGSTTVAVARAQVGAWDKTGIGVGVPLPSVGAALASLFLSVGRGF